MGSEQFLKMQVGLQTAFGTAVAPTVQLPLTGDYADERVHHTATWDSGTWTPTTIVALERTLSKVTVKGTAMFEVLPILLNSMWADVAPSATYLHSYVISPAAVGVPMPLTALVGAVGENLGVTGPAVKLKDLYVRQLSLAASSSNPMVALEAELFGTGVDDNSGAGYAFASTVLPTTPDPINGLKAALNIEAATTTGGAFATMTAFTCAWEQWKLTLKSGLEPQYSVDGASTAHSAVRNEQPAAELTATIRTNATNYALVKGAADARTYMELQLLLAGSDSRLMTINLTGRWTAVPSAHDRENKEVVMKATFAAETSHLQIVTPHWLTILIASKQNWT